MVQISFGARLRHERERRGILLASIAANTKIAPHLLEALERDDVSRWPAGIYRRSFIRAYAEAVGLDATETAHEFFERFPDPVEPAAAAAAAGDQAGEATGGAPAHRVGRVRLTIERTPEVCHGGAVLTESRRRVGAVASDLGVLVIVALGCAAALGEFWMPLAIAMGCYYLGGILMFGNTPGVCLFAAIVRENGDLPARPGVPDRLETAP